VAGPAASPAGLGATLPVLAAMPGDDGFLHGLVWWFALMSLVGVLNLLPFRIRRDRRTPPLVSDGRRLMDALSVKWALR
jgi:hypothetical protein